MIRISRYIALLIFTVSFSSFSEESSQENGFISDDLFVYMHAGAGNNYRIVGSINAGSEIAIIGDEQNGYKQILDNKNRKGWVETKYISTNPSLRNVIAELNTALAEHNENLSTTEQQLTQANNTIDTINGKNTQLTSKVAALESELVNVKSKLKHQDQEILQQWFFRGAIVLGLGLLIGLILPKFLGKKRKSSSWS